MSIVKDNNRVPVIAGLLDSDGSTVTLPTVDPTTHILDTDDDTSGSDNGGSYAVRDDNGEPVLIAVSSSDGVTPVALYVDSSGNLLVDSS